MCRPSTPPKRAGSSVPASSSVPKSGYCWKPTRRRRAPPPARRSRPAGPPARGLDAIYHPPDILQVGQLIQLAQPTRYGRSLPGGTAPTMYSETTRSIKVTVQPFYLEQHSSPDDDHYVWAYHVRIENVGAETVQLRNR